MRNRYHVPVGSLPPFTDSDPDSDPGDEDVAARGGVYVPCLEDETPAPRHSPPPDPINPPHYRQSDIECIDAMRACSTREEYEGHLRLTALKYLWRLRDKGSAVENARKAQWYLTQLVESLGGE